MSLFCGRMLIIMQWTLMQCCNKALLSSKQKKNPKIGWKVTCTFLDNYKFHSILPPFWHNWKIAIKLLQLPITNL